jgi:hypothetical protein
VFEVSGRSRFYHCEMLCADIAKRERTGDTRAAVYIDETEATLLLELLSLEMVAIRRIAPAEAQYWDKYKRTG